MINVVAGLLSKKFLSGTLICALITNAPMIYLFSDGRVSMNGVVISEEFSKVHQITQFSGMLTAGIYLDSFKPLLIQECKIRHIKYIDEVSKLAKILLTKIWEENKKSLELEEAKKQKRVFVFLVGYSANREPKLYYLDSVSRPRFSISQRRLFQGNNLEVAALVSNESNDDATNLMIKNINSLYLSRSTVNIENLFLSAFDKTKDEINSHNNKVGGKTFFSIIDPFNGFKNISNP